MAGYVGTKAVLLSTTAATVGGDADIGGALDVGGGLTVDNDGSTVLTVDRATSDGTIIDLQKSGSSVGSIGVNSSDLMIGTGDTGMRFSDGEDSFVPSTITGNANRDNAIDLGKTSSRFKDLYLSGNISMGGKITGGQFSYTNVATLSDDSVYVLDPVNSIGIVMFNGRNDNYDYIHGIVSYRTSANTYATQMGAGSGNVVLGEFSGVPTISNVTNGYFSVVVSNNGNIYFWNRLGIAVSFGITLLGS